MAAQSSDESSLLNATPNADRAVQAAPASTSKDRAEEESSSSRMRLDMDEVLGLKRR